MSLQTIAIEKVAQSKINSVDFDNIVFGRVFTDHMLMADYQNGSWTQPIIKPFGSLPMHPAMAALHYGQSIFEGLKAYKNKKGEAVLFRPVDNWNRMNASAQRMCMTEIPYEIFIDGMIELVKVDQSWIPEKDGSSLYIRPFLYASDEYVGIRPSDNYRFIIFCSPVNTYYPEPISVKIEEHFVRAAEGGVGAAKTSGNYAASLYPNKLSLEAGYRQLIWTDAKEHKYIEESGTMNVFFVINDVLITPATNRDTILKGVTRNSVIQLANDFGYKVEERRVTVEEVIHAAQDGSLQEVFGTGTAATIAQIKGLGYREMHFELPAIENRFYANTILKELNDIRVGNIEDRHNWVVKIG